MVNLKQQYYIQNADSLMKCHTVNKNVKETQKNDLLRQEVTESWEAGPKSWGFLYVVQNLD